MPKEKRLPKCSVKECKNEADPRWFVNDDDTGASYPSCDGCGGGEYAVSELDAEAKLPCETCDDEGTYEGQNICGSRGGCRDGMCGGCFSTELCDCAAGEKVGAGSEPDYDAIGDERRDERGRDEVDWESPE
jgi:hypothetical protein